jgi:putative MATE family efflux protein
MYQCVDGLFVSNFVDTNGLGAINIVYPFIFLGLGISLMIGTGGSALIGKALGEKNYKEANSIFTLIVVFALLISIVTGILGTIFIEDILLFLGATGNYYEMGKLYLQIHFYFIIFYYLQNMFQIFFVTAGRPKLGLVITLIGGITNIVLDYVLLVVFDFGIEGAAIATGISYIIPSLIGLYYFTFNKKSILKFSTFRIKMSTLRKTMVNGSSEMLSNIANSVTTFLFNYQFFRYYSYTGVDSITIVLYFQFLVSSMMFGFSMGVSPVISYKFGEGNKDELKQIKKNSFIIFGT